MVEHTSTVVSKGTGIAYTLHAKEIPDGCNDCSGEGTERYVTEEDQARFDAFKLTWDEEDEEDDEDCGPWPTGVRPCSTCNGTGSVKGNGPLFKLKMTL